MLDFTRAVINNINQIKYLKNIDRISLEKELDRDTNVPVKNEGSSKIIKYLEEEVRVNNLKVCFKNYFFVRRTRFVMISLPAFLTALAISTFFTPKRVEEEGKVTECIMEETIYSSKDGLCEKEPMKLYRLGDIATMCSHVIVDSDADEVLDSNATLDNSIDAKIHNGEECVDIQVSLAENGAMSISSANVVSDYFDLNENENLDFHEYEEKEYDNLFDRIVEMLKNSRYLESDDKSILDNLTRDEKREIIIRIVRYNDIKSAKVIFSKTRLPRRVILTLISIIYWVLVGCFYFSYNLEINDLDNNDGTLSLNPRKRDVENLFYESIKIKEAFMAAEKMRINNLKDAIDSNVAEADREKILTGYEKKLLKKDKSKKVVKDR